MFGFLGGLAGGIVVIILLWYIVIIVQEFLNYGTAYRLTRNGGNNGLALFGWMLVLSLAAIIPGLCIYLWFKYRDNNDRSTNRDDDYE